MIQSYIGSLQNYGMVLKLERLSYLSNRSFGFIHLNLILILHFFFRTSDLVDVILCLEQIAGNMDEIMKEL